MASSSFSPPFSSIFTLLDKLKVVPVSISPTSEFSVRCVRILLVYITRLELSTLESLFLTKMTSYRPQVWAVHTPADAMKTAWYTCVLIHLSSTRRFETKNRRFFDFLGQHYPHIYPIHGRKLDLWNAITEHLNIAPKTVVECPEAFYAATLSQSWQGGAIQWLTRSPVSPTTSPILNLHSKTQLDPMIRFYKYMLYNHYQDTLVFPMGLPGKCDLIKDVRDHIKRGWSGMYVIIMLGHESYHFPRAWPPTSIRLQQLCDGTFTHCRPPAAILILSLQPITAGALNTKHVEVVDLEAKPGPAPTEDDDCYYETPTLAEELFPGVVVEPKHDLGHYTQLALAMAAIPLPEPPPEPPKISWKDPNIQINKPSHVQLEEIRQQQLKVARRAAGLPVD